MFEPLVDLVLPRYCVGCREPGTALCRRCVSADGRLEVVASGVPVLAYGAYGDALRRALIVYKERGRRDLARALGALLALTVRCALARFAVPPARALLVPVPSTRAAAAARGGDHLVRLARRAAARAGVRVAPAVLRPTRVVLDSAGLGAGARAANLFGSMRARAPDGRVVLVVDDIVTTGATVHEARRALLAAGWPVCGAAVVAATLRRVPGDPLAAPT